jgi:G3E family GTPase
MDEDVERVPVTVLTGFLGAGKTTVLDAWLREHPRGDVAVIVNEVGTIGIDGELLGGERARALVEITGGCICCATHAELVQALARLATREPRPARIFVETSGAASPAGVLRAIFRGAAAETVRLDGIVTVVDATRVEALGSGALAAEQIGYADVLVLSRADLSDAESLSRARSALAARNGTAVVAASARGALVEMRDGAVERWGALLSRRSADLRALPLTSSHRASSTTPAIESMSLSVDGELDEDRLTTWVELELARYEGRILRIKGILAIHGIDQRVILQGVADHVEVTVGADWGDQPRSSRVVLVGFALDHAAIEASLRTCVHRG